MADKFKGSKRDRDEDDAPESEEAPRARKGGKGGKPKVSKFASAASKADPADVRGEEFDTGKWCVTLKSCHESDNGAFCFTFNGAGKNAKIGERIQWFSTTGKATFITQKSVKRLCMVLVGIEDKDEYNDFDPHGEFLDAIVKGELDAAAEYMAANGHGKSAAKALAALEATEFMIIVRNGGEKDDGSHFKNADFAPLGDAADDEDEEDEPESERPAPRASKHKPAEAEDEEDDEDEDEEDEPESEPAPRAKKKAKRSK